jgi:hypothetical protein
MKRFLTGLLITTVAAATSLAAAAPMAAADYGSSALYQITFSQNCNNASFCLGGDDGLGGDWGWAAFNTDHTGDLVIAFCGHLKGFGGGAGSERVDLTWDYDASGFFVITSASDPSFVGQSPIPTTPGHYNMHPAPGVAIEVTLAQIPGRTAA